jgi:hypothetical protein
MDEEKKYPLPERSVKFIISPKMPTKNFKDFCLGSLILQGYYKKRVYVLFARR